jgi:cytoskeletal protein CcmA (bactofilin family)
MSSIWRRRDRDANNSDAGKRTPDRLDAPSPSAPKRSPFEVTRPVPEPRGAAHPSTVGAAATGAFVNSAPPIRDSGATTVLGRDITFKGELRGSGSVKIDGRLEGAIYLDREVTILRNGKVKASIEADIVHVDGELEGDVVARQKIVISERGVMRGDIKAKSVVVAEGASFKGRIEMDQVPSTKDEAGPEPAPAAPKPTPPTASTTATAPHTKTDDLPPLFAVGPDEEAEEEDSDDV